MAERKTSSVKPRTEQEDYASKEDLSEGMKAIAEAMKAISSRDERPINVDVASKKKRVRSAALQAKIDKANKGLSERVPLTIPAPANDEDAKLGYAVVEVNGKAWQIYFDRPVMVPKSVANAYAESVRLQKEAVAKRRAVLNAQRQKINTLG